MHLTDEDIAKLGALGRLSLSPEQRQAYAEQLSRIVEYTDRIRQADVAASEASLRIPISAETLRHDVAAPRPADDAVDCAPKREGRFIVSPPIA